MDDQRLQIVSMAQLRHLAALQTGELIRRPLPGAGGKNLKRVAAKPIRSLSRVLHAPSRGSVDADPARSKPRRPPGCGQLKDVLFLGE